MSRLLRNTAWLAVACLCCGCAELTMFSFARRSPMLVASPRMPVGEIICLWEPAEGLGLDGLPTRGFAGQILFFSPGRPQPLKVNGDVRIYVFDDHGTQEEQSRPIHYFDFTGDAWNAFLRDTNIGGAYQMFVPYTRKTALQSNCSIRVRYTPADGGAPVYSKMASLSLPGRARTDRQAAKSPEGNSVRVPEGAPAPAESASSLPLGRIDTAGLQSRLAQLQSAAASAAQSIGVGDGQADEDDFVESADRR